MASNAWAIHGNYTETGQAFMASDPHLRLSVPSTWYLIGLHYDRDTFGVGGSMVGMPFIGQGKTNHFTFGMTASLADISDVFKEKLNDKKDQYFLDGKWENLKIINEEIKIKGEASHKVQIKLTHRGPLIDATDGEASAILYGGALPKMQKGIYYSLQWTGYEPYESILSFAS